MVIMVKPLIRWRNSFSSTKSTTSSTRGSSTRSSRSLGGGSSRKLNNNYSVFHDEEPLLAMQETREGGTKMQTLWTAPLVIEERRESSKLPVETVEFTPTMTSVEIQGMSLLHERDGSLKELQQANRIMYFHALQLIRKQKKWLEHFEQTSKTTAMSSIHQRMKALGELEAKIEVAHADGGLSLSPQKALFKATALLEDSLSCVLLNEERDGTKTPFAHNNTDLRGASFESGPTLVNHQAESDSCSDIYCETVIKAPTMGSKSISTEYKHFFGGVHNNPVMTDYDGWMKTIEEKVEEAPLSSFVPIDNNQSLSPKSLVRGSDHYFSQFDEWMKELEESEVYKRSKETLEDHPAIVAVAGDEASSTCIQVPDNVSVLSEIFEISRIEI